MIISDGNGNPLTRGLQPPSRCDEARQAAQRWADRLGAPVWLASDGEDEGPDYEGAGERFDPTEEVK